MWASALLIGASPALVLQRPAVPLLREARLPRRTTMLSEQPAWLSRGQGADLLRRDQELGLLALIEGTDRGVQATDEARRTIAALIGELEDGWRGTDAFSAEQAPWLLRRTEVAYVGQASSGRANAAGGKYRGRVGRLLFRTTALFQHVLPDALAVNVIQLQPEPAPDPAPEPHPPNPHPRPPNPHPHPHPDQVSSGGTMVTVRRAHDAATATPTPTPTLPLSPTP